VGPLLSWTFPNIAVARARIRQAQASNEAALATFDGTVLTALSETEQAMSDLAGELDRQAALVANRDFSAEAARIVQLRYGAGAENFLAVLDAQRTLATAEAQLASSQAALVDDQVAVFKALGGGWENAPEPTASQIN
jgi:outer membrane protein TolC